MKDYIFDTNIFNQIIDESCFDISHLKGYRIYVTHIQWDELNKTPDNARKQKLLKVFKEINPNELATESLVLDISKLGKAKLGDGELYTTILNKLNEKKQKDSNRYDSLIGETAYMNNMVLVSNDGYFSEIMQELGCTVVSLKEFLDSIGV